MRYNIDKWIAELDKSLPKKASLIVVFADDLTRDKIPNGLQSLVHIFLRCSEPSFNEKLLKEVACKYYFRHMYTKRHKCITKLCTI